MESEWARLLREFRDAEAAVECAAFNADSAAWDPLEWMYGWIAAEDAADEAGKKLAEAFRARQSLGQARV